MSGAMSQRGLPRRMWSWRKLTEPPASSTRPWSSRLCCQMGWRWAHPMGVDPRGLCGSGAGCRGPWSSPGKGAGHRPLHGRRLRKQAPGGQVDDHRGTACEEDGQTCEALPDPGGDLSLRRQQACHQHGLKAGVKKDGTLTALEFSVLGTGGAYPAGGTAVDSLVKDLYQCPNVRTELTDVYINAGPARPFALLAILKGPGRSNR